MIQQRLQELRNELAKGERQIELLDRERDGVRDTILRIQGAIQVLEELSAADSGAGSRPVLAQTS